MGKSPKVSSLRHVSPILPHEVLFVINPNSGRQRPEKLIRSIKAFSGDIDTVVTKDKHEAKDVYSNQLKKYRGVVIVGGDGTINDALQDLAAHKDIVLGVIPNGSGNGFSRELGFDTNISRLMSRFRKGETLALDLLEINGEYSINVSGIGIDSQVAHDFQHSKKRGLINYMLSTFRVIRQFKDFDAQIDSEGTTIDGKYRMISIANTRQFGNNAFIAPKARPDDGFYELVLIKPFPLWKYPGFIVRMFAGRLKPSKYVEFLVVSKESRIRWSGSKYHLDGEPKDSADDLHIKIFPNRITVLR